MPSLQILPMSEQELNQMRAPAGGLQVVPMNSLAAPTNALVPAASGGLYGVRGKMTAPYTQSPYTPGASFVPVGGGAPRSAPTAQSTALAQQGIQSIKLLAPMIHTLVKDAPIYQAYNGEKSRLAGDKVLGAIEQHVGKLGGVLPAIGSFVGLNPNDLTQYNEYKATIPKAADQYLHARNLPVTDQNLAMAINILTPGVGEGPKYANRMLSELNQLQGFKSEYENILKSGYGLTGNNAPISYTPTPSAPKEVNHGIWNNAQLAAIDKSSLSSSARRDLALGKMVQDQDGNTWVYMNGQLGMKPAGK